MSDVTIDREFALGQGHLSYIVKMVSVLTNVLESLLFMKFSSSVASVVKWQLHFQLANIGNSLQKLKRLHMREVQRRNEGNMKWR